VDAQNSTKRQGGLGVAPVVSHKRVISDGGGRQQVHCEKREVAIQHAQIERVQHQRAHVATVTQHDKD